MSNSKNELVIKLFGTLKEKRISVPRLSEETGIPKDRIYKWQYQGTTPKAEDSEKINMWLSKTPLDKYPEPTMMVQEPPSEYGISVRQLISQQNKLIQSLNKQSETANTILKRIADKVETKVETIDTNLSDALERIDFLKADLLSQKTVVLKSLSRLEGKGEEALLKEEGNINIALLKQLRKQGTSPHKSK